MDERKLRRRSARTASPRQLTPLKSPRQSPRSKSSTNSKYRKPECEVLVRGRKMNLDFPENVSLYRICREWLYDVDSLELYEDPKITHNNEQRKNNDNSNDFPIPEYVVSSSEQFDDIIMNVNSNFDPKEDLLNRFRRIRKNWVEHRYKLFEETRDKIVNETIAKAEHIKVQHTNKM